MKLRLSELRQLIREAVTSWQRQEAVPATTHNFAATASEEAKKINDQLGPDIYNMTLVTDQEHWNEFLRPPDHVGDFVATGEQLAISLLNSTYSDLYKSIHGIRPRHRFKNVNDVTDALNDLEEYYDEVVTQREFDIQRQKEIDREKAELDALMPGKFDFEHEPKQVGMGRGAALKELRQIIREEVTKLYEGDPHKYKDKAGNIFKLIKHKRKDGGMKINCGEHSCSMNKLSQAEFEDELAKVKSGEYEDLGVEP